MMRDYSAFPFYSTSVMPGKGFIFLNIYYSRRATSDEDNEHALKARAR